MWKMFRKLYPKHIYSIVKVDEQRKVRDCHDLVFHDLETARAFLGSMSEESQKETAIFKHTLEKRVFVNGKLK